MDIVAGIEIIGICGDNGVSGIYYGAEAVDGEALIFLFGEGQKAGISVVLVNNEWDREKVMAWRTVKGYQPIDVPQSTCSTPQRPERT